MHNDSQQEQSNVDLSEVEEANIVSPLQPEGDAVATKIAALPNEILDNILRMVLSSSTPGDQVCTYQRLRSVSNHFHSCVDNLKFLLPNICNPSGQVGITSVRRLMVQRGVGSSLVLALKEIISRPRWMYAWLELIAGHRDGWFKILNIY